MQVVDLTTEMCGLKFKNPVIAASCGFGSSARMAKRAIDQGVSAIVTKTIHHIPSIGRWPRPHRFMLKKFGEGFEYVSTGGEMFSHIPYDKWITEVVPELRQVCRENNVRLIISIHGTGDDLETWKRIAHDQESLGAEMLEVNLGGPHATFGADEAAKDVGAAIGVDPEKSYKVTKAVVDSVSIPVMCKMTPVSAIGVIAQACQQAGAAAISANNSVYGAFIDPETGTFHGLPCLGGVHIGRGFICWSLAKVIEIKKTVHIPVSGIGGVHDWDDVARYIMAGCPTVQVATAAYLEGVEVFKKIIGGLEKFMERKDYKSINDFLGMALKDAVMIRDWPREDPFTLPSPVRPQFDISLCRRPCDICERLCPYGAIYWEGAQFYVNEEYCMGCGECVDVCPRNAIKLVHVDTGEVIWNGTGIYKQWVK